MLFIICSFLFLCGCSDVPDNTKIVEDADPDSTKMVEFLNGFPENDEGDNFELIKSRLNSLFEIRKKSNSRLYGQNFHQARGAMKMMDFLEKYTSVELKEKISIFLATVDYMFLPPLGRCASVLVKSLSPALNSSWGSDTVDLRYFQVFEALERLSYYNAARSLIDLNIISDLLYHITGDHLVRAGLAMDLMGKLLGNYNNITYSQVNDIFNSLLGIISTPLAVVVNISETESVPCVAFLITKAIECVSKIVSGNRRNVDIFVASNLFPLFVSITRVISSLWSTVPSQVKPLEFNLEVIPIDTSIILVIQRNLLGAIDACIITSNIKRRLANDHLIISILSTLIIDNRDNFSRIKTEEDFLNYFSILATTDKIIVSCLPFYYATSHDPNKYLNLTKAMSGEVDDFFPLYMHLLRKGKEKGKVGAGVGTEYVPPPAQFHIEMMDALYMSAIGLAYAHPGKDSLNRFDNHERFNDSFKKVKYILRNPPEIVTKKQEKENPHTASSPSPGPTVHTSPTPGPDRNTSPGADAGAGVDAGTTASGSDAVGVGVSGGGGSSSSSPGANVPPNPAAATVATTSATTTTEKEKKKEDQLPLGFFDKVFKKLFKKNDIPITVKVSDKWMNPIGKANVIKEVEVEGYRDYKKIIKDMGGADMLDSKLQDVDIGLQEEEKEL